MILIYYLSIFYLKNGEKFYMRNCCDNCRKDVCTKKVPIFTVLNSCELIDVLEKIVHKNFKKNEIIFLEGGEAKTLYFINEGRIKLYKYTRDGKEQIMHILSEGDFFGELNLLKESKYGFNAKAIEDCKICTLTNDNFKEILLGKPEIAIKILEVMGERLSRIENLAQNLATNDMDARMTYLLLELSQKYGRKKYNNINIDLPINREDMASYIGVTRETISRKLKKFEEEGLIKIVGTKKIVILDKEKLSEYI